MGNYYIDAAKTISEVVGLTGDQASAMANLANPENRLVLAAGGASAAKIGVTMVETLGKKLPEAGTGLTVTTLLISVGQIYNDADDPSKVVKTKDILSAAGDVARACVIGCYSRCYHIKHADHSWPGIDFSRLGARVASPRHSGKFSKK
jgi:hypothetical protein